MARAATHDAPGSQISSTRFCLNSKSWLRNRNPQTLHLVIDRKVWLYSLNGQNWFVLINSMCRKTIRSTYNAYLFSELPSPANGTSLSANNVIPGFVPGMSVQGLPGMPPRMMGPIPGMPFPIPGHPPMMPIPIPGMPFRNPGQPGMIPFPGGRMPPPEVLARMVPPEMLARIVPPGTTTVYQNITSVIIM